MLTVDVYEVVGWDNAIRGMRNPMNSWDKSDSYWSDSKKPEKHICVTTFFDNLYVGPNDLDLMKKLAHGGSDDRKFMRMITVYVDITAPLYWWKEFDTYKVGTVSNSCSTMHKIHDKEFTMNDFSLEHLKDEKDGWIEDEDRHKWCSAYTHMEITVNVLNAYHYHYLETKDKKYWWQMIQLLPSSYNQKRTVMLNYEVLRNIYNARKEHKLDEWKEFCEWIKVLPLAHDLIIN